VVDGGNARYEGLLVSLNKHLSHRYQFSVSYAFQSLETETVVDLRNYKAGYGPALAHHNLNVSGIANLPWGFGLSFNTSAISRTPVEITTNGLDLSGTGAVSSGPLPTLPFRGLPSASQLKAAVTAFNTQYAGKIAPSGAVIVPYVLPPNFQVAGRPQISQDARLTKTFTVEHRYSLALYGEVFNIFNIANLTGYSENLDRAVTSGTQSYAFGQATARAGQVFLSSGPRAEQIGARFSF